MIKITIEQYKKEMDKIISKKLPMDETFVQMIEFASRVKIKGIKNDRK